MNQEAKLPLFSIVVPACNVAGYVGETIESIRNQTDPDFEVFLVVEDSTDETLEVCREATAGDERFKIVQTPRSGSPSAPRNYGMRHAVGRYLVFLDGDDWIEPDSLARFRPVLENGEPDLLLASGNAFFEEKSGELRFSCQLVNLDASHEGKIMTGNEVMTRIFESGRPPQVAVWLSVYRREFLLKHDLFQVSGLRHEDQEWTPRVWYAAERVAVLDYAFVNYRKRSGSVTTQAKTNSILDIAAALNSLFDFWFSHEEMPPAVKRLWASFWLSLFSWYFYHPQYKGRFSAADRRKAFFSFFDRHGHHYREVARYAPFTKRMATPLLLLAWKTGWEWPARCYFRCLYYPLIELRNKVSGK